MTLITFQDGNPVLRDGKVGTEQHCCCGCNECRATIRTFIVVCGDEQTCIDEQANFESLQAALEANGWTVTLSTACREGDTCVDFENNPVDPECCLYLDAECSSACSLAEWAQNTPIFGNQWGPADHDNNPDWFNLTQSEGFTWGSGGILLAVPCLGLEANLPYDANLQDEFGGTTIMFAPVCNPLP